jgi:glycosyltransferase involved in cell wall biosynthesis
MVNTSPRQPGMVLSAQESMTVLPAAISRGLAVRNADSPRIAVIGDLLEENWPSMDLVAEMLLQHLQKDFSEVLSASLIRPPMRRRLTSQGSEVGSQRSDFSAKLFNADRVLNRFWDYPRFVKRLKSEFDLFHVVDHSYGQLLHELPPAQTVVTCHDLDTFKCLLNPDQEPRSILFRKMMSRTLSGFSQAARVTCDSNATRDELLANTLVAPERAVVVPNGVHPSCSPNTDPVADAETTRWLGEPNPDAVDILHVGSTIPRKRIDVLLQIFAELRKEFPGARLVRVGGPFTPEQMKLADELEIGDATIILPHLDRNLLAAVYRRAAVVLLPSEREGFGLPVAEAMACGTPVIASELPVLREVGGEAALYCPVGDISRWTETVTQLLIHREGRSQAWKDRRQAAIYQARGFSWAEYAKKMVALYQELL